VSVTPLPNFSRPPCHAKEEQRMSAFYQPERVKVRRNSHLKGTEFGFWESIGGGNKRAARRILGRKLRMAKHYTRHHKAKGQKHGGLGHIAIEILEELIRLVDYKTGRLEPSYKYLASRLKRSIDAISRGLKQLRAHGFLDWKRRFERSVDVNGRTISVQTSNAYRIMVPKSAEKLFGLIFSPAPIPLDEEQRRAELEANRKRVLEQLNYGEQARFMFDNPALAKAMGQFGENVSKANDSSDSANR